MQIRCTYCRTPFAIRRDDLLYALSKIDQEGLKFFNFPCPSCRRANRINATQLQKALPEWRTLLQDKDEAA